MLCEKCKKNIASTHIKTNVNGKITEKYLCSECAKDEGFINYSTNSLGSILASMFDDTLPVKSHSEILRCPVCNSSFDDISKTGKVGCSECYETFKDRLLPYLKRVHGSTKHIGKSANMSNKSIPENELSKLKKQLEDLIREEKFEEAAIVRDKIKDFKED